MIFKQALAEAKGAGALAKCLRLCSGITLLAALVLTAGCASRPDAQADPEAFAEYEQINDPLEPFNRAVFQFNRGLDAMLLKPLAIFYQDLLPPPFQRGIRNVLSNLREPQTFFNDLLQAQPERAGTTLMRFVINSTLGVGGLNEVASDFGWEHHEEDFGQTLAVWGVDDGPYLMLPVLGPSSPRDATGRVVDSLVIDPFGLLGAVLIEDSEWLTTFSITRGVLSAAEQRARVLGQLEELERTSLDFYAAIRSGYRQNREHQVQDGLLHVPSYPPKSEGNQK
ncbi:MAG: VacJ family lipoprotein [Rhodospirillales bacterium]|nr:VacJ family lipoprotein [Rhodospirillales bacterium]